MSKSKKLLSVFLLVAVVLSFGCMNIFAATSVPVDSSIARAVTPSTRVVLNSGESSQIITWPVAKNYGFWKIQVDSTSADYMTIRIHKGSPTGQVVFSGRVSPRQEIAFYCEENAPLSQGSYYISVSTNGNAHLGGNLYYKFTTEYDELFN